MQPVRVGVIGIGNMGWHHARVLSLLRDAELVGVADLDARRGQLAVEQFGYGLGFAAYLMVMILIADGAHKTAHYAICTGFMALGMMVPGFWSGWLQDQLGYVGFFTWVMVAAIPSFLMTALIRVPEGFGRRQAEEPEAA